MGFAVYPMAILEWMPAYRDCWIPMQHMESYNIFNLVSKLGYTNVVIVVVGKN